MEELKYYGKQRLFAAYNCCGPYISVHCIVVIINLLIFEHVSIFSF